MRVQCSWKERMKLTAEAGGYHVDMDAKAPIGDESGFAPKQLLLAAICGCTGMDVLSILRKSRQPLEAFGIDAEAELTTGAHPVVFKEVSLTFRMQGAVDAAKALEAVRLSQSRYCGVSAMVSASVPISYTVDLNGKVIGSGNADFSQAMEHRIAIRGTSRETLRRSEAV